MLFAFRPLSSTSVNRVPLLSAKFTFDDYIRCLAARQRLTKGRMKARQKKMQQIAKLLDLPSSISCGSPPSYNSFRTRDGKAWLLFSVAVILKVIFFCLFKLGSASRTGREHRSLLLSHQKVPGFAAALRREVVPGGASSNVEVRGKFIFVLFRSTAEFCPKF